MCYNFVTCVGRTADINKLKQTIQNGIEHSLVHHEASDLGVDLQEAAFFDLCINEHASGTLQFTYETKWTTNLLDLAEVCKMHGVSMVCEYVECSVELYGTAHISPSGEIVNDEVPAEFLELIELNDEDFYVYNGIEYNTQGDIIEEHYAAWKELQPKTEN